MVEKKYIVTLIACASIGTSEALFSASFPLTGLYRTLTNIIHTVAHTREGELLRDDLQTALDKYQQYCMDLKYGNLDSNTVSALLIRATNCTDLKLVNYLIKKGANVNFADESGRTALHYAVHRENPEIVSTLIKAGANVSRFNKSKMTPLMQLVQQGEEEALKRLLTSRPSISLREIIKKDAANNKYQIMKMLLRAGASPLFSDEIKKLGITPYGVGIFSAGQIEELQKRVLSEVNLEYRNSFEAFADYIDTEYDVPRDVQRFIIRDMLGTTPEQMPFK